MGQNSNRGLTREEEIAQYAKEVAECRNINDTDFQISTGAEIRGKLGIEKGNDFIRNIRKISKK